MRLPPLQAAAAVAALALLSYVNTFGHGFVFDDKPYIRENHALRTAGFEVFLPSWWHKVPFNEALGGFYRPLTFLTLQWNGDFGRGEPSPVPYHVTNWLLHAGASVLAWLLARRVTGSDAAALVAGALFAVHPIHTEAVAWVSGRAELLWGVFGLGSLAVFAGLPSAREHHRTRLVVAALVLQTLALLSKENAVAVVLILPLMILATPALRAHRGVWWAALPFAVLTAVHVATVFWIRDGAPDDRVPIPLDNPIVGASPADRGATAFAVLARQVGLLLWPAWLSCDYSYAAIPVTTFSDPRAILGLVLFFGLLVATTRSFGAAFFLASWFPISNLPVVTGTILAERLLYVPSLGLCLAAGVLLARWPRELPWVAGALVVALGARTLVRNTDWRSERRLQESALAVVPRSAKVHLSLAGVALDERKPDEALRHADEALAIYPGYPQALVNQGIVFSDRGDQKQAEALYRQALRQNARNPTTLNNLGVCLAKQERYAEAAEAFRAALHIVPHFEQARLHLAQCEELLRPKDPVQDAMTQAGRGDVPGALAALDRVLARDGSNTRALLQRGNLRLRAGRAREALADLEEAARREPEEPGVQLTLAYGLASAPDPSLRDPARAVTLAERAVAQSGIGRTILAEAYAAAGDREKAARVLREALRVENLDREAAERRLKELEGRPGR